MELSSKQQELKKRYESAESKKEHIEQELQQAYMYTLPQIAPMKQDGSPANRSAIFDGTPTVAVNTLVSNLMVSLIPHNSKWASIEVRESVQNKGVPYDQIHELQNENDRLWELIHDSNFYVAASEALTDCVISGVGCMAIEMNSNGNGLNYIAVPISQLYMLENGTGEVDTIFRDHDLPVRSLVQKYNVPNWVHEIHKKNPDELVSVIESSVPTKDGKFEYQIQLEDDFHVLESYITVHKVFTVFRWRKSTGDVWADSPVRQALPDIKTLNTMVEQYLQASEFASFGAWQTSDPTLEGKQLKPGNILVTGGSERLEPIQFPGQLAVAYNDIQTLQASIKSRLFADQLPPAGQIKGVVATAINAMQAQFFRQIVSVAGRLEVEFLREIIVNSVRIAGKNGLMRELSVQGEPLQISVHSVVSKGLETEAVLKSLETLQMLSQNEILFKAAMEQLDANAFVKFVFEKTEFPKHVIKDESEQPPQQAQPAQNTPLDNGQGEQLAQMAQQAMGMMNGISQ